MKKFIFLALFSFTGYELTAQPGALRFLMSEFDGGVEVRKYPQLQFEWNFSGRLQASVNDGLTNMDEHKYERAVFAFDKAIGDSSRFGVPYYYRGICHKILGNKNESIADLEKAAAFTPAGEVWLELGEAYQLSKRYEEAEIAYERAIDANPKLADAYYYIAYIAEKKGNLSRSTRYYKLCNEVDPHYPKAWLQRGLTALAIKGNEKAARKYFDLSLEADSTYEQALFWRGFINTDADRQQCISDWSRLIRFKPDQPVLYVLRGIIYMADSQYDKAYLDIMKAYSGEHEDEDRFRGVQSRADKRLDIQFALNYFTRAVYGHSDDEVSLMKKGLCLLVVNDDFDLAINEFRKVIKSEPSSISHFLAALAFEHSKRHDSAFFHYDKALQFDNEIFDAHKKRGIYFTELGNWKAAYKDFEEMARIEPSLKITYRLRGVCRLKFNDFYGTIIDMSRYLERDTSDFEIYSTRAFALTNVRDFPGANRDLKKAIALKPDDYDLRVRLIENYLDLKDTTNTMLAIDTCLARHGDRPEIVIAKIRILIAKAQLAEARSLIARNMPRKDSWGYSPVGASLLVSLEGQCFFREQNYKAAFKKFNSALKTDKANHEALYFRAKTSLRLGDHEKARADFQKLAVLNYADSKNLLAGLDY